MQQAVAQGQSIEEVESWAAAASRGDTDAMGRLYERYVDAIYRFVYVRAQDHALTEDVCSEVWLRVVRFIPDYSPSGNGFPAWLYTVARNTLTDSFRRASRRPETPTSDMLNLDSPDLEVGPEEAAVRGQVAADLARQLSRLPAKQAQSVTLRFFDGLTLAETASVMGTTVGGVKQHQYRALKTLARILPKEMRVLGAELSVSHVRIVDAAAPSALPATTR